MDDLSGLSWNPSSNATNNKPQPMISGSMMPNIRHSAASGQATPMSVGSNRSNSPYKPSASAGDSFANLVSFNTSATAKNMSLLEQQKRLQEEKAKKAAADRQRYEAQYGGQNAQFWDTLEHGRTPSPATAANTKVTSPATDEEDDILAAFSATAPVDASTNFPIPSSNSSPAPSRGQATQGNLGGMGMIGDDDDDDPFGLSQLKPTKAPGSSRSTVDDNDDFLGLLGKPVSEIPRAQSPRQENESRLEPKDARQASKPSNQLDRAIAELVDMGFPAEKSREALMATESGTDVQAAVSWLLTQAHAEARQKSQGRSPGAPQSHSRAGRTDGPSGDGPAWMREGRSQPTRPRDDSRARGAGEKDPAQIASQLGNNFLKTAGSLWKTGSKKFQQAVNEFNADHDPSQPKWMRDTSVAPNQEQAQRGGRREQAQVEPHNFTNEALLLEARDSGPARKPTQSQDRGLSGPVRNPTDRQPSPAMQNTQQANFLQRPSRPSSTDSKPRASRFAAEEHSAQAYVSPARRRRPQPPPKEVEPTVDLFSSPIPTAKPSSSSPQPPVRSPPARSAAIPVRAKVSARSVPPVSAEALQSTHRHRELAAAAYKRGDYATAHQSFSTALTMLPDQHPIAIIIRSNRAMTALKIGEPKAAIDDTDIILNLIGSSKGEDETIDLGNGEAPKPMKDFFGKALMRKAEALEQLERWADAAYAWKSAVESGHGGGTSIQGRNRCEKAAGLGKTPTAPSAPARKRPTPAPKRTAALSNLHGGTGEDSEAVSRLRQANKAAERADEERFALTESVDAKIAAWRNGKQDNLRALLGSLDTVLWPESGWKKIGLSELVLPNKVKIQYMKGIGKVHPDKISTTATTEQRMIAGAVFGTLNEAWDKFRAENNL
ncbi:Uncharacterized protein PECH_008634 [Penicillium ucsense]|uniref:UBA domain-containing protein n=1 Tax=Penicillium ucsense TaxID=2839758 RepID=A0A8J8WKK2_9EURO|nr:Uncharacterized protein PECM_005209 [Penicillium ucsense]KAF7738641.1 Uncharacterized protein PECH_008634 [Penicillium ucsense]